MAKATYVCYSAVRVGQVLKSIQKGNRASEAFQRYKRLKNVSVYISRRSPVSTLLLSCVPGGGVKSSETGAAIIEEGEGRSR